MRRIMRNTVIGTVLVYAAMAFSGYAMNFVQSASAQHMPQAQEVKIDNFSFGPVELTIPVGTTVTWTNRDDIPHTVVSTKGVFKSKVLDTDEKFSFTFMKAGSYPYFCSIHPKMTGKIIAK
jgi:plastocyanin